VSPTRWIVAIVLAGIVGALLMWQHQRESAMSACLTNGGIWNGPRSTCEPARYRPVLQRDLQRS
jgi:hypothetical protein